MDDAFRTGLRRSAWVPVVIGGAGGVLTGVWLALRSGAPSSIAWDVLFYGPFGLLTGVVVVGISLATASLRAARWLAPALSTAGALGLGLLAGARLGAYWMLIALVATASAASIAHMVAARRSARTDGRTDAEPEADRPLRIMALLAAGALGIVFSPASIGMLRTTLHVGCSYGAMGEAVGSWACADGIGYIFYGVALLACSGVPLLVGLLVVMASGRPSSRLVLRWLAAAPLILTGALLAALTLPRTDELPAGVTWIGIWSAAVGVPLMVALLGTVCVAVADAAHGVPRRILLFGGAALLLAAFIVQPGLGAAICAAGGLVAAALEFGTQRRDEHPRPADDTDIGRRVSAGR